MKKITLVTSLLLSLNASAALYDRGNGMIYDSDQNITWLQDANYAATSGYAAQHAGGSGASSFDISPDGLMGWDAATAWADQLVYEGFSDWRLPSAGLIANPNPQSEDPLSFDGSTNRGYNNTRSEIGHLFLDLGNVPICSTAGSCDQSDHGFIHTGPFLNVQNYIYWESEQSGPAGAWVFLPEIGFQIATSASIDAYAWAVRDGDVAAVPVPAAGWLFGSGMIGLIGAARRRKCA